MAQSEYSGAGPRPIFSPWPNMNGRMYSEPPQPAQPREPEVSAMLDSRVVILRTVRRHVVDVGLDDAVDDCLEHLLRGMGHAKPARACGIERAGVAVSARRGQGACAGMHQRLAASRWPWR